MQPDVTKVGGISEQIQIARMANEFGVKYIGHGWNTAIGLAADLQLASAVPDRRPRRIHRRLALCGRDHARRLEPRRRRHDRHSRTEPGLGVTLDRDALRELTRNSDRCARLR